MRILSVSPISTLFLKNFDASTLPILRSMLVLVRSMLENMSCNAMSNVELCVLSALRDTYFTEFPRRAPTAPRWPRFFNPRFPSLFLIILSEHEYKVIKSLIPSPVSNISNTNDERILITANIMEGLFASNALSTSSETESCSENPFARSSSIILDNGIVGFVVMIVIITTGFLVDGYPSSFYNTLTTIKNN